MKQFILQLSLFFVFIASLSKAQTTAGASEILSGFRKLNTVGSVLYVAAHPDDENTRLLSYMAKERVFKTAYLSITRGDGGQNLIGKEQGEALGLIRTQELLAARKVDGAEQFFTRANDFGYSKNPEETFAFWNKDSVLSDVVWVIRKFRPDVIICRFPTTGEGGHGHHTASAILALEAFEAAADPKRFPEQLSYTQTWQAKRIFWNTFNFGGTNTTSPEQLKLDIGVFNPLLGKGYGEIAAESRSNHKSQGFGSAKSRGTQIEYFKLLKGAETKSNLFDQVNTAWSRFPQCVLLQTKITDLISKFSALEPSKSVADLTTIYSLLLAMQEKDFEFVHWKNIKLKEIESLILQCAGIWCEAAALDYIGIPGNNIEFSAQFINRSNLAVKLNSLLFLNVQDTIVDAAAKLNELLTYKHKMILPESFEFSNPYWLNEKHDAGTYTVKNRYLIGMPENLESTNVVFRITLEGITFKILRPLIFKSTDPVKGEVYRPFEILPPATINFSEKLFVWAEQEKKSVRFTIHSNIANLAGTIELEAPKGWVIEMEKKEFELANKNDEFSFSANLSPGNDSKDGLLSVRLKIKDKVYSKSIKRIDYDHIPFQFILSAAEVKLLRMDLKKSAAKIGYIPGAGDEVQECLKQVGYAVTQLTEESLQTENLTQYSAIITGVRAYNTNNYLQNMHPRLMEYVNQGGNLIVQYNTNNRIGPLLAKIGPYPFTISRERVTDEHAEVRFLKPGHSILNFPNKLNKTDFENWVQERGIYFASDWDKNYESILSINDPNEKANEGSLIVGKYGKGNFVYTGLVFFRELPAGVAGAYRLMANLISLPKN
jgi:LmbE family N-acetylglucosaminyl deacetylase